MIAKRIHFIALAFMYVLVGHSMVYAQQIKGDGKSFSLDSDNAKLKWSTVSYFNGNTVQSIVDGNNIWVLTYSQESHGSSLMLMDANSGKVKWRRTTGTSIIEARYFTKANMLKFKDKIAVACYDESMKYIKVFDAGNGEIVYEKFESREKVL